MVIYMMIGNTLLWILEVPTKHSYYSKEANKEHKSQSDYVETPLLQKVKKGNLYSFCKRGINELRIQEQKQKEYYSLCCVNENHQMIINDVLYKGQKVIHRVCRWLNYHKSFLGKLSSPYQWFRFDTVFTISAIKIWFVV